MATAKKQSEGNMKQGSLEEGRIQGRLELEGLDGVPENLNLMAYLIGSRGQLFGMDDVSPLGEYSFTFKFSPGSGADLIIAPKSDPDVLQKSAVFRLPLSPEDFGSKPPYALKKDIFILKSIWYPWFPITVCVSGRVRNMTGTGLCPVPFVKVEIYDVDREACWWPPILKWWDTLIDKVVIDAVDLLKEPPHPPIGPGPVERAQNLATRVQLNPQPLPPGSFVELNPQPLPPGSFVELNPQPLPPRETALASAKFAAQDFTALSTEAAQPLQNLVISSQVAPWFIFPYCFYSKALVCETSTDCNGYFTCCFNWYPWHFRNGRFRFDPKPDIILKVTQVIGGVSTVIYMDPYTSTRWNVNSTFINLVLNNPAVICGSGCRPEPTGKDTFFTLVGLDEVYKIDQMTGKFSNLAFGGPYANWAYGGWLLACALFGQGLTNGAYYYRLSYKKGANPFVPVTYPMSDTRVDKITLNSDIHTLGPQTVNGTPDLYEIRDMLNYYWYNPDKIGWLNSESFESDSGLYTLRLEVFDNLGNHLTSAVVNYLDGSVPPPGPLPPMVDHCDLNLLIDNRYPDLDLNVIGATGDCGVVPCANRGSLAVTVFANQPHNRLYSWSLYYVKGLNAASGYLGFNSDPQGISPLPVNLTFSGMAVAPLLSSTETCAYSLTLSAWPLVRNGFGVIHYAYQTKAIAIEGC